MILLLILLTGLVVFPYVLERARLKMDETARADAPGDFCSLKNGLTHYRYFGPKTGPLVVCVHGLTTPCFVFEAMAKDLVAKGHRVLVYDHYGRGYSDRPRRAQDRQFFVEHLHELLDGLGEKHAFDLIGYSMGGVIASAFSADHPERVKHLILLAPAGMGHELGPLAKNALKVPLIGDWLFMAFYARMHRWGTEKERALLSSVEFIVDRQQRELGYRGFVPAILASLHGVLSKPSKSDHLMLATQNIEVTAIWGAEDAVIPISGKDTLMQWNAACRHIVILQAGHGLAYTHVAEVVQCLKSHR